MISSSLFFGIYCQLDRGSVYIDKYEDPSSLKMKWENSDRCWCEKNPSFV